MERTGLEIVRMHRLHNAPDVTKAIAYYNRRRKPGEKKMTQKSICRTVVPDKSYSTAKIYLSKWSKENPGGYKITYGIILAQLTGLTLEELHNID